MNDSLQMQIRNSKLGIPENDRHHGVVAVLDYTQLIPSVHGRIHTKGRQ